jgi:hypothetical protein
VLTRFTILTLQKRNQLRVDFSLKLSAEHIYKLYPSLAPCRIIIYGNIRGHHPLFILFSGPRVLCSLISGQYSTIYMSDAVAFASVCNTGNLFFATRQYNKLDMIVVLEL